MNWDARAPDLNPRSERQRHRLAAPAVLADRDSYRKVAREHAELQPVVETAAALARSRMALAEARELVAAGEDAELVELAEAEAAELTARVERLEAELRQQLVPKDPLADRAAVVEIRAGTGGDEAGLFAADLYRMYSRYADRRDWD